MAWEERQVRQDPEHVVNSQVLPIRTALVLQT